MIIALINLNVYFMANEAIISEMLHEHDFSFENETFEDLIEKIKKVIESDHSSFGKVFTIAELVKPEIINNIDIPGLRLTGSKSFPN
jgi:hypothetical protein